MVSKMSSREKQTVCIDFITSLGDSEYKIEGYLGGGDVSRLDQIKIKIGKQTYKLKPTHREQHQEGLDLDRPCLDSTFESIISLDDNNTTGIDFIGLQGVMRTKTNRFSGLSRLIFSSKLIGNHVFSRSKFLSARPLKTASIVPDELWVIASIIFNWRIPDVCGKIVLSRGTPSMSLKNELLKAPLIIIEAILKIPESIVLRTVYRLTKNKFETRTLWLVSDRVKAAGDNGEAFFRYAMKHQEPDKDVRFIISRKSPDYNRIRSIGPVVAAGSIKHRLLMLHAHAVISSQADTETINPFIRQINHFVDLMDFNFVFLQHGIIRHDLSDWLNRFNRNIALFVTSSLVEYHSIIDNDYHYTKNQVLLSGLPRYDLLRSDPKRKLLLIPTYRGNLLRGKTNRDGERAYEPSFNQSKYFVFYNNLMNDPRILASMGKHDMTGELYLHPVFASQQKDFMQNSLFAVMEYPYDYSAAFREGSMLISDHSSVVFDFAYLKKPVLYAHFDVDTFFDGHSYGKSNFFDDEQDGFGEVCCDYESLVDSTVRLIDSGCIMEHKYKDRVDKYFYKTDQSNSKRVYSAVQSIKKEKNGI